MGKPQPILMPKLGLTMTEGMLAEWKVAPGDRVAPGDVIFVVETDKIANEIEASESGTIDALLAEPGEVVAVGTTVATLVTDQQGTAAPAIEQRSRLIATPLARRMASESGVDIASVTGSGPRGRIMADDISATLQAQPAPQATPAATSVARGEVKPLGKYQKVAARRLTEAKRDIPHFYVFAEADVTELLNLRAQLNSDPGFVKLTVNHFIIAAVARALGELPEVNRVWVEDGLLGLAQIDIGLAVESPKGLLAPVLQDLGGLSLDEIAGAATKLVERARGGRLSAPELEGGATSISNVGMFGATALLPIINPGQSSILGIGRSQSVFRPDEHDQPTLRQVMNLALSCDHRVIDGALAARFLQQVQDGLERPWRFLRRSSQGSSE
jgi:pyruvate dehydrogenase E2 component (dihydrolipoamide acetyltransferase)